MEPTARDVDRLIGPATPHFAYQIRQRVENLVGDLPAEHPVRAYAAQRLALTLRDLQAMVRQVKEQGLDVKF